MRSPVKPESDTGPDRLRLGTSSGSRVITPADTGVPGGQVLSGCFAGHAVGPRRGREPRVRVGPSPAAVDCGVRQWSGRVAGCRVIAARRRWPLTGSAGYERSTPNSSSARRPRRLPVPRPRPPGPAPAECVDYAPPLTLSPTSRARLRSGTCGMEDAASGTCVGLGPMVHSHLLLSIAVLRAQSQTLWRLVPVSDQAVSRMASRGPTRPAPPRRRRQATADAVDLPCGP
jgi:hypothetical protein